MRKRGEQLRADVLTMLRRRQSPLSAYDILGALRDANLRMAPPTVYRGLTVLMEQGEVHRLESLNAYIACQCGQHQQATVISICDDCGAVEERTAPDLLRAISTIAEQSGFAPRRHVLELRGLCSSCGERELLA